MTYDQWKTDSGYDERDPEDDEPECEHPYWKTRWAFLTGKATCGQCGAKMPWCKPLPFVDRLGDALGDFLFWWRLIGRWQIGRPWRSVRAWWRGWRKAPWKPDDDLPF